MAHMSQDSRRELIQRKLDAADRDRPEYTRLTWKGEQKQFPVLRLPLKAVVLNPNSHRIQSQLMSHPEGETVRDEPFTNASQELIAEILRETDEFEDLRENLDERGQIDPGVITRDGVLINANRRAVALRDLGEQYINVAVLPEGASPEEISELELQLQMQKRFRQEYTFTNQLLFIRDLVDAGYSDEDIALMMNLAASKKESELKKGREEVNQLTRVLAMIEDVREIAKKAGAPPVPYTFFDGKRQSLLEIDDAHEKLKKTDPSRADRLRQVRLVGLLSDAGYADLREMDEKFLEEHLIDALDYIGDKDDFSDFEGDIRPLLVEKSAGEDDEEELGLDVLGVEDEGREDGMIAPDRLLDLLAGSHDEEMITLPRRDGAGEVTVYREELVDYVTAAITLAADDHKEERRDENRLVAPMSKSRDVVKELNRLRKKIDRVHDRPDFDWEAFENEFAKVRDAYEAVIDRIARVRPKERSGSLGDGEV
jgi:hypothetical protein